MKLVCVDIKDNKVNISKGPGSPAYFSQAMITWLYAHGHTVDIVSTLDEEKLADADVVWCEWISELAFDVARANICKKLILRMRGVDLYAPLHLMEWGNVHTVVFESPFLRQEAFERYPWLEFAVRTTVQPTGIDTQRFAFQPRVAGKNIAVVARCMADKGFQLIYEAARQLESDGYRFFLGIAHANANPRLTPYLLENKPSNVTIAHNIDPATWLNVIDAHYIMSASNYETLGYSIVEGMALGLKPLIHRMPGAELHWQPEWLWTSLSDLIARLQEPYDSQAYRAFVEQVFSVDVCGPAFEKLLEESNIFGAIALAERALRVDVEIAERFITSICNEMAGNVWYVEAQQELLVKLGRMFCAQGQTTEARAWLTRALANGPYRPAFEALTGCAIVEKRWEEADMWLQLARTAKLAGPARFTFSESDSDYFLADTTNAVDAVIQPELRKARYELKLIENLPIAPVKHLAILVPVYNAEMYVLDCLRSIKAQLIWNVEVVSIYVLDDASTDRTGELAQQYCQEVASTPNWQWIYKRNEKRVTALPNLVAQLRELSDDTVVAILDGDDRFAHTNVLADIAGKYRYHDIWMTYGNVITSKGVVIRSEGYPVEVILNNTFRQYPWRCYHLKTFINGLFKKIDESHFKDDNGDWWQTAYDVALYTPMLEMAGVRAEYIPEILYIWNCDNEIGDSRVDPEGQVDARNVLFNRAPYKRLDSLK